MVVKVTGAVGEDVHVRRQSGNALNFAAATVKRNRCTDCIVFHDIHFIFIIILQGWSFTSSLKGRKPLP